MPTLPSVEDVAFELRALNAVSEGKTIACLQVFEDGKWWVHDQISSVDTQERSYISTIEIPGRIGPKKKPRKFDYEEVARYLLEEIQKQTEGGKDGTPNKVR